MTWRRWVGTRHQLKHAGGRAMSDFYAETYIVNRRTGVVHIAVDGKTEERCNVDDLADKREVGSLEDIGSVTRHKVRFCKWCMPETVP